MATSKEAQRNRDELFRGEASALALNDPEFNEYFENFAFDETLRDVSLDTRTRLMVQLAAIVACQGLGEYRAMLGGALNVGVTPIEVKEILYQAVPYVGIAKVFDFIQITNDVLTEHGIELPVEGQSTTTPETRAEKGLAVQKQVVGADVVEQLFASAPADQIRFARFLAANCFGDLFTRTGLVLGTRELLTFAMLVSLGGCEPQAKSHAGANVKLGNDRGVLLDVITVLLPFIGYPRTLNALGVINEVTPASAKE